MVTGTFGGRAVLDMSERAAFLLVRFGLIQLTRSWVKLAVNNTVPAVEFGRDDTYP